MDSSSLPPDYLEFALKVESQLRKTLITFSVLLGFVIAEALGHLDFDYRMLKRIVKRRTVGAMTLAYFLTRITGLLFIIVSFQQTIDFQIRFNLVTMGVPPEIKVISKAYSAIMAMSAGSASAILLLRLPALQNGSRFGLPMVAVVTLLLWVLGFVLTAFTKQLKTEGASRNNLVSPTFAVPYFLWMLVDCFAANFLVTSIMRQQNGLPKRGLLRRLLTDGVLFMILSIAANLSTALVILKNLSNFFSIAASASINVVICSSAAQHLFRSQSRYVSNNKTFGVESDGIISMSKQSFSAHSPQVRHSSSLSPDSSFYNSNTNRFKARKALQRPLSNDHDLEELDAETFKERRAFSIDIESGGSPRTPSGSDRGLIRERTWSTGASQDLFTGVSKFSPFTSPTPTPTPKEHLQLQPLTPATPASYKSATSSSRFHTPISMMRRGSVRTVQSRISSAGQGFEIEDDATSTPPQLTLMDRRNVRGLAINDITPYLSRQSRSQYPSSIKSPLTNALNSSHEKSHQESEKVVSQNLPRLTNSLPAHFGNRREKDSEDDDSDLDPDISDSRVMSKVSERDFKSSQKGLQRDVSFQSQASRSSSAQAQVPILPIKSDLRPTSITERLLVNDNQHHSTFSNYTSRPRVSQTPDVFDSTSLREANSSSPIHTESTSSRDCNHTILKHSQSYASLGDVTRVKNNSGDGEEECEEMEMKENANDDDEADRRKGQGVAM